MAMVKNRRFGLNTVVATALLVGFVGFGLGFNWTGVTHFALAKLNRLPNRGAPADLNLGDVQKVYDTLRDNFAGGGIDAAKLVEGAERGLVAAAGDPYTVYLNADDAKALQESLNGTFSGIGAEISVKNGKLVVISPVAGSPAAAAGLAAGDAILSIDDKSTEKMTVDEAVKNIRGPEGSSVKLEIQRGREPAKPITIKRAVIKVPAVKSALKNGHIGYVALSEFGDQAASQVADAMNKLHGQGADRFVLDLRNNPGGLLSAAVDIASLFLDSGKTVVEERKGDVVLQTFRTASRGSAYGWPVVVLVNGGSASASEIVAGALHDNGAAKLVGTKTFGKGSVQELEHLGSGAQLKVTIALWYTPNGRNISKEGIEPDTNVELSTADFNADRDPQLARALAILKSE